MRDGFLTKRATITCRFAEEFESELAYFLDLDYAMLENFGSSANILAFTVLTSHLQGDKRLKSGDEVVGVAAGFPTTNTK